LDKALKKTVILFDLDGTLLDSTDAILKCFDDSFGDCNIPTPPKEDIKALIGHPLDYMYLHLGIEEEKVWDMVNIYKSYYRKRSKSMTYWLPHAKEAIIEASKFARLGVVTTKTGSYSMELLEHMGVMKYFEVLIGRENVIHPKPHPEPILKALNKMKIKDKSCVWMIGDTCMDMVSAKDAGIGSIGVLCGYATEEQLSKCSQYLHQNVLDSVRVIKKIKKSLC
jgi:phosphoglycolate phosphatase